MTPIYHHLKIFLVTSIFLGIQVVSYGQVADAITLESDSIEATFEKIMLDDKLAYLNKQTKEIISPVAYLQLKRPSLKGVLQAKTISAGNFAYDYWDSKKVNPYKDVVLPTPFKIQFNQTTFTHPVDHEIKVTSRFGRRRYRPHRGLDIDLVTGDVVRSVLPGKVRFVGYSSGHGKTVIVRHANDIETVYAHLSGYEVQVNELVAEGQILGLGGNTGRSTGSHLHLEVRYKGVCIHPEYVFNFDGSQNIRGSELWVTKGWKSPRAHSAYRKSKLTPIFTKEDAILAQNSEPRFHRVRKGETLSHISMRYHLRIKEICKLNSIYQNSVLSIGQLIKIR